MTIPSTTYPDAIDTDQSLFFVSDGLRVRLVEDYNPGDTSIVVLADETVMSNFSSTGIITLTEQCSDPEYRALSFYYSSKTSTTFDGLELLPGFIDAPKYKDITNVTQNVMSLHHNNLKNALIKIENFAGKEGEVASEPLKGTMEQRINYLRKLVLPPKAWFKADKTVGLVPLTVNFTDLSFRLGTDGASTNIEHLWNFGDNNIVSNISYISIIDGIFPSTISNVEAYETCPINNPCVIEKTYNKPGLYDVSLTVTNDFGSDTVVFEDMINVRYPAPNEAVINFVQKSGQLVTPGQPLNNGPYTTFPKIRSPINSLIEVKIADEINRTPIPGSYTDQDGYDRSQAGEVVDQGNTPIDPISSYTWSLNDDLNHNNNSTTKALFGAGGYFDLALRTDTKYGSYRITLYPNAFDIIENYNLWLWNFNDSQTEVFSYEFGLISETFKTKSSASSLNLYINSSFLDSQNNSTQQKKEFLKNNGSALNSNEGSGDGGTALIYWASGRSPTDSVSAEKVYIKEYSGFLDTYSSRPNINRPWNWVSFASTDQLYFILGGVTTSILADTSPTNQNKDTYNLSTFVNSQTIFANSNYKNGAFELTQNVVTYTGGQPDQGHMSVYRSTWHYDSGYFLRNSGVNSMSGNFFRIKSFYKTSGFGSDPFVDIKKLNDMPGSSKVEGQLVSLSQGVYFFNNSGSVTAYSPSSGTWASGGPGFSSTFRSLQDTNVLGFDNSSQTLLAASDADKMAYLSFDYSNKSFIKFSEIDTTFSSVGYRPSGKQWQMTIF
jgi:PKD repeat protein